MGGHGAQGWASGPRVWGGTVQSPNPPLRQELELGGGGGGEVSQTCKVEGSVLQVHSQGPSEGPCTVLPPPKPNSPSAMALAPHSSPHWVTCTSLPTEPTSASFWGSQTH